MPPPPPEPETLGIHRNHTYVLPATMQSRNSQVSKSKSQKDVPRVPRLQLGTAQELPQVVQNSAAKPTVPGALGARDRTAVWVSSLTANPPLPAEMEPEDSVENRGPLAPHSVPDIVHKEIPLRASSSKPVEQLGISQNLACCTKQHQLEQKTLAGRTTEERVVTPDFKVIDSKSPTSFPAPFNVQTHNLLDIPLVDLSQVPGINAIYAYISKCCSLENEAAVVLMLNTLCLYVEHHISNEMLYTLPDPLPDVTPLKQYAINR